ncbi:MAG: hypothetical protein V3T74_10965, partial [Gemmatimonadales bacterium]
MTAETPDGGVDRREFLKDFLGVCGAAAPVLWFGAVSVPELAAQDGSGPYDPTEHLYGMGIDVAKCIGCARCVVACKTENDVPEEEHFFNTWIERYVLREDGEVEVDSPNGGIDGFPPIQ